MAALTLRMRPAKDKAKSTRTRPIRRPVSYREDSSEGDEYSENHTPDESAPGPSRSHRRQPPPASSPCSKPSKKRNASGLGHKRAIARGKRAKISLVPPNFRNTSDAAIQFTGKAMPWQTLPYHILASIFDYASRPLIDDAFNPLPSISWLVRASLCCKAFAEPALSALYYSPPLSPPSRVRNLILQLQSQTDGSSFNYQAKVKYLDVEAVDALLHKSGGQNPIDLGGIVASTPQLRGIGIHLLSDNPKYRKGSRMRVPPQRTTYQRSLFTALQERKAMLQDWTWNQSLAKDCPLAKLKDVHKLGPFQTVRNLSFVNYKGGLEKINGAFKHPEDMLADALNALPNLNGLSFRMSSVVNERLVPMLPNNLQDLEMIDCPILFSRSLKGFLIEKGRLMRTLILDHNQSLNLSFVACLGDSCPNLEVLKMDLRYLSSHYCFQDTDPKYTALIGSTEKPTWPASLQTLELQYLRKWSLENAEVFFSSLTDAAESLTYLRQLKIKASLDQSGWRERVGFRDKWTQRLRCVFLRISPPPDPNLKSIAAFKFFKAKQRKAEFDQGNRRDIGSNPARPSTRSDIFRKGSVHLSHVEIPQKALKDGSDSDSDVPLIKVRRSTRAKAQRDDMYALSQRSPTGPKAPRRRKRRGASDDSSSEDSAIDDDGIDPLTQRVSEDGEETFHVQGLCDVVDILIDNLRPTEEQLNENDFLDDEASGDEDWNGDDNIPGEGRYAW
ncbi:hypothetical protein MMC28_005830 [Mycoblastus sanguinarius]|nr:hypothetical protein [Mycoblastus sanguinarius]